MSPTTERKDQHRTQPRCLRYLVGPKADGHLAGIGLRVRQIRSAQPVPDREIEPEIGSIGKTNAIRPCLSNVDAEAGSAAARAKAPESRSWRVVTGVFRLAGASVAASAGGISSLRSTGRSGFIHYDTELGYPTRVDRRLRSNDL